MLGVMHHPGAGTCILVQPIRYVTISDNPYIHVSCKVIYIYIWEMKII